MALLPLIILAIIQGITEFLPISSSGHLVLVHAAFGGNSDWNNHLIMDVSVHVGTLASVLLYFRRDVALMIRSIFLIAKGDIKNEGAQLNINVIIASLPVIAAGFALHIIEPDWSNIILLTAWTTLIFGALLWWADRLPARDQTLETMSIKHALLIGVAQTLALIPGTSRSGITMTAARYLGYDRTVSAKFSLLLAIIAITGAGTIGGIKLLQSGDASIGLSALIAAFIAFIVGWISIALMMKWLEKCSFAPFAIYRIILGVALLALIYGGML